MHFVAILGVLLFVMQLSYCSGRSQWRQIIHPDQELRNLNRTTIENLRDMTKSSIELDLAVSTRMVSLKINKHQVMHMENLNIGEDSYNWKHAGIYLVVVDSESGVVLASKRFVTNQLSPSDEFTQFLRNVQSGRLLVIIAVPEWLLFFGPGAVDVLLSLGFHKIDKMCNGEIWLGVALKGTTRILVEIVTPTMKKFLSSPVKLEVVIPKVPEHLAYRCKWHSVLSLQVLKSFCQTTEGYGDLCSCKNQFHPNIRYKQEVIHVKEQIPVVIVTAKKPHLLTRLLLNLFTIPGAGETNFLIACDGFDREIANIADIFGIDIVFHRPVGERSSNTRTNVNIRFALVSAFQKFPKVDKIIVLEEDLVVAPDFFRYFHFTSWVLDNDPTVYCVNGFSYNSLPEVANNSSRILRVEGYPWYGWMVKKSYALQAISHWVKYETRYDWDWWLLREDLRRGRDVLVPEVSRVFHAGGRGVHVSGYEQYLYYNRIRVNTVSNPTYQEANSLVLGNYIENLRKEIKKALVCTLDLLSEVIVPENTGADSFVSYLRSGTLNDEHKAFEVVQRSLKTYYLDTREHFRGVMIFRLGTKTLFVVGCPMSQIYCPLNIRKTFVHQPTDRLIGAVREKSHLYERSLYNMTLRRRIWGFDDFNKMLSLTNYKVYYNEVKIFDYRAFIIPLLIINTRLIYQRY